MSMGLAKFGTDELLEEIVRRRNARIARRPIIKCDECRHFVFEPLNAPDDYNPCAKQHVMSFRTPEADDGPSDQNDDWGHYLRVCPDREGPTIWSKEETPRPVGKSVPPKKPRK